MQQEPVHSHTSQTAFLNEFLETIEAELVAIISMFVAQMMTFYLYYQHYYRNTKKQERRCILNIIPIVTIYGLCRFPFGNYSDTFEYVLYEYISQFYGAHAMYNFLRLCYEYLGGEENIMTELSGRTVAASWITRTPTWIYTDRFHRFCKYSVLQFWVTKAICLLSVGILKWWFDYREKDWGNIGYICITVSSIISAVLALYALTLFIGAVRNFIKPDPTLKFFVVTVLVYLIYWQGVALAILENVGVIAAATDGSGQPVVGRASTNCQNFLVLIELVVAAMALQIAFPATNDQPTPIVTMREVSANSRTTGITQSKDSPHYYTVSLNQP